MNTPSFSPILPRKRRIQNIGSQHFNLLVYKHAYFGGTLWQKHLSTVFWHFFHPEQCSDPFLFVPFKLHISVFFESQQFEPVQIFLTNAVGPLELGLTQRNQLHIILLSKTSQVPG